MRDRNLAPAALADAIVCCGAMALIAGLARHDPSGDTNDRSAQLERTQR